MNNPLVTIAIPAYKRRWLSDAIKSAISQDYNNIEIVIVDDDSPQGLYDVIKPFLKDKRIRYYKNERNLGVDSIVNNWNRCLAYSRGTFFVLLCDDDVMSKDFVSSMLMLTEKYPKCAVYHARKWNMEKNGTLVESPIWPEYEDGNQFVKASLQKLRHHTVSEFLIRTHVLRECGGYVVFPSGFYSDKVSIIQLAQLDGVASSMRCLFTFRCGDEHITGNFSPKNCWDKYQAAMNYWIWIKRLPDFKLYYKQIREDVECTIYDSYRHAPLLMKMKILLNTPSSVVSFKYKLGYVCKSLFS